MPKVHSTHSSAESDLRDHFHNYFELLLDAERSKLQQAIGKLGTQSERHDVLIQIDCRIYYLRGAVRMGKLLGLIDHDEAKINFGTLSLERDRLRSSALGTEESVPLVKQPSTGAARIELIKKSLRPTV
ncbi:hypothetical protein GJ697_09815 [Pseudoduganella sp. FT25W]|uniref:Uncharacterized protein n=1 Tax=Duganella alba TaxID=2666081 RepID=A0A6L5QF27_9BURK|nr:hypothetical protein [Duganella alba]MRX08128.1 hypothetical protein [Duganella alba]MRX16335.1 hypothetical protein [Duganella alba]